MIWAILRIMEDVVGFFLISGEANDMLISEKVGYRFVAEKFKF